VVICLEQGADLAQLMPLPLTVSCFSKIQIGFTFLVPAHPGSPGKRVVKRVCVCVYVCMYVCVTMLTVTEILYFATAAVAVDSSHMTASSSASWSRFSPPSNFVNGHVSTMCFIVCRWPQSQKGDWAGETPFLQDSTTWALTRPETVHQRPCLTRKIKTCCRIVGSVTIVWMTTEADDQSSVHRCHV